MYIKKRVRYLSRTQGSGGYTDGDYTVRMIIYSFSNRFLLKEYTTSCQIVHFCPICGTYGTQGGYSCTCHEDRKAADAWYAFRDLLRALCGEANEDVPGWAALKGAETRERVNKEVVGVNQAYAVMAVLDLFKLNREES